MNELALKEIERELEFAKMNHRGFFYINKNTVTMMVQEIRRLQALDGSLPTKDDYIRVINAKLDLIIKCIDDNN